MVGASRVKLAARVAGHVTVVITDPAAVVKAYIKYKFNKINFILLRKYVNENYQVISTRYWFFISN